MAIQMRRGMKVDFDPEKMLAGEWAVSIDGDTKQQWVWMCFGNGIVKRMGTWDEMSEYAKEELEPYVQEAGELAQLAKDSADSAKQSEENIKGTEERVTTIAEESVQTIIDTAAEGVKDVSKYVDETKGYRDGAGEYAELSKKWAVGTSAVGEPSDTNNAKYWSDVAKSVARVDIMKGATATTNGTAGLVPMPVAGDQNKVLRGDGTWGTGFDVSVVKEDNLTKIVIQAGN